MIEPLYDYDVLQFLPHITNSKFSFIFQRAIVLSLWCLQNILKMWREMPIIDCIYVSDEFESILKMNFQN